MALVVLVALLAPGCIGAVDRSEFDAEVRARGGGITNEWVADAFVLIADEVAVSPVADLRVTQVSIDAATRSVTARARRGDRPDFVDQISVRDGTVRANTPVQDADRIPLDTVAFRLGDLPIERLDELVDAAIAEFDERDGAATAITISRVNGEVLIVVVLESPRRTGSVTFDIAGAVLARST